MTTCGISPSPPGQARGKLCPSPRKRGEGTQRLMQREYVDGYSRGSAASSPSPRKRGDGRGEGRVGSTPHAPVPLASYSAAARNSGSSIASRSRGGDIGRVRSPGPLARGVAVGTAALGGASGHLA